jgi:type III secretion protein T
MEAFAFAESIPQIMVLLTLGSARFLGFLAVFPMSSAEFMPATVRNGLAIVGAAFMTPLLMETLDAKQVGIVDLVALGVKEAAVGALIGFAFGTLVWVFEALGAMIEFQSGASNSQVFDPLSNSESGLMSKFLVQLSIVLFLSLGGLTLVFKLIMESYIAWPVDAWIPNFSVVVGAIVQHVVQNFWTAFFQYAVAGIFCTYLVEIFFGVSGKYAPQLNIFQLSLPVKSAMLLLVLATTLPGISIVYKEAFDSIFNIFRSAMIVTK